MITERVFGEIPEAWKIVRLKKVLTTLRNGLTVTQNTHGKGYPVTRIETISEEKIDPNRVGYISELSERDINEYRLIERDILFSHINSLEHIGKTAIYEGVPKLLIHGMNLLMLRPNKNEVYPEYLLYTLKFFKMRNIFRAMAKKAVNQASINQTELGRLKIALPSLPEQRKIAKVLSGVDGAIRRVNESIAKTGRLKKGLIQKLLIEGIGHKEFRETKIGKIPKTWKVRKVRDLFDVKTGTTPSTKQRKYWKAGTVNWMTPTDLSKLNDEIYIEKSERTITKIAMKETNLTLMPKGSIIISTRAPVGYVAVLEEAATFNQGCKGLIPKRPEETCSEFYCYYLLSKKYVLVNLSGGSTFKELSKKRLESFYIPLISYSEQKKISEILSAVDYKLGLDRKRKGKLERIKRGLMNDLLAGKRRVKVAM